MVSSAPLPSIVSSPQTNVKSPALRQPCDNRGKPYSDIDQEFRLLTFSSLSSLTSSENSINILSNTKSQQVESSNNLLWNTKSQQVQSSNKSDVHHSPVSLITIIYLAIYSTDKREVTLEEISDWIFSHFVPVRGDIDWWEDRIRCTLRDSKLFKSSFVVRGSVKKLYCLASEGNREPLVSAVKEINGLLPSKIDTEQNDSDLDLLETIYRAVCEIEKTVLSLNTLLKVDIVENVTQRSGESRMSDVNSNIIERGAEKRPPVGTHCLDHNYSLPEYGHKCSSVVCCADGAAIEALSDEENRHTTTNYIPLHDCAENKCIEKYIGQNFNAQQNFPDQKMTALMSKNQISYLPGRSLVLGNSTNPSIVEHLKSEVAAPVGGLTSESSQGSRKRKQLISEKRDQTFRRYNLESEVKKEKSLDEEAVAKEMEIIKKKMGRGSYRKRPKREPGKKPDIRLGGDVIEFKSEEESEEEINVIDEVEIDLPRKKGKRGRPRKNPTHPLQVTTKTKSVAEAGTETTDAVISAMEEPVVFFEDDTCDSSEEFIISLEESEHRVPPASEQVTTSNCGPKTVVVSEARDAQPTEEVTWRCSSDISQSEAESADLSPVRPPNGRASPHGHVPHSLSTPVKDCLRELGDIDSPIKSDATDDDEVMMPFIERNDFQIVELNEKRKSRRQLVKPTSAKQNAQDASTKSQNRLAHTRRKSQKEFTALKFGKAPVGTTITVTRNRPGLRTHLKRNNTK